MRKSKGITLIALVITIVVLIILAAVAINLSLGNNGLFKKAKMAAESYTNEQEEEKIEIAEMVNEVDSMVGINRGGIVPKGTLSITKNGEYDVSQYEKVNVNVSNNIGENNIVSLIPNMTSNTAPSGTVEAGSVYSGRQAWWAFCGESPNINSGDGYWYSGTSDLWLSYTWGKNVKISLITFYKNYNATVDVQYLKEGEWINIETFEKDEVRTYNFEAKNCVVPFIETNAIRFVMDVTSGLGGVRVYGLET